MKLNEVNSGIHKHKKVRRIGRGPGSGRGKTSTRGGKGQRARAGFKALPTFQGGTTPLVRRVPKRGFHNRFALLIGAVNVADLESAFGAGEEVNPEALRAKGLLKHRYDELKILGNGELTKSLRVMAHRFSESAREKIVSAGGEIVVLPGRGPAIEESPAELAEESSGEA
jgi:large subunit ribosomal protein L15